MAYSPEEAQAAVAGLVANPIPATARQTLISGGAFNSWDIRWIPGMPGRHYGDVRIEDQEAEPTNPGIREVTASTYGQTIPVSLGRRRLPGNIIQSTQMRPRLVGERDYEITYQIPIYEDPPDDRPHSVEVDPAPDRPRPDPEDPPGKCGDDPCGGGTGAGGPGDDPAGPDEPDPGEGVSYLVGTGGGAECCAITEFTLEELSNPPWYDSTFSTFEEAEEYAIMRTGPGVCSVIVTLDAEGNEVTRSGCYGSD